MRSIHAALKILLVAALAIVPAAAASSNNGLATSKLGPRRRAILSNKRTAIAIDNKPAPPTAPATVATSTRGRAKPIQQDAVAGALVMTLIERGVNYVLKSNGIKFPSQLGGCIFLFAFLLLADAVKPGLGESIFVRLSPGSALLSKWLAVFFVPGLAMLPLAPSVGSGMEVVKVLATVILGFLYSITTVAFTALFLRAAQGQLITKSVSPKANVKKGAGPPAPKAYTDETMSMLAKASVVAGAVSIAATRASNEYANPLRTIFHTLSTLTAYVWSARLPSDFNKVVHPIVSGAVLSLGVIRLTGAATGESFKAVLRTYKVGSLDLMKIGAGDLLLFCLGPAVVSFAMAMYSRKKLLKENLLIVASSVLVSSAGGLFGTAAFVRAIKLGGAAAATVRLSVLSRNVTTALSMAIVAILGGDISIAASVVILSGIIGATYGRTVMDALGIADPVARGLAIGSSGQGLGVASLINEPDALPFAAMGMVLTAVSATVLVSIPAVREPLIKLAVGA